MTQNDPIFHCLTPTGWQDYALIDSGNGRKLERFGRFHFIRPEAQAMWQPFFEEDVWNKADGIFTASAEDRGGWQLSAHLPDSWDMQFEDIAFQAMATPFRHLGFFPEQSPHWQWCEQKIKGFIDRYGRAPRLLNLFAYSGLASLHAARAGAEVTHIDASKKAIAQAFDNRSLAGLEDAPIRFITEDASRFVEKEVRRHRTYDGIMLDPPKYGRGPKGEIWQIHEDLPRLLQGCQQLLSDTPLLFIITIYAIRTSTSAVYSSIADLLAGYDGQFEAGELAIAEDREHGRLIGQALFVRWSA